MKKIYDDGRFGISRTDQFVRPAMMPRYDCEDEVDSEGRNNPRTRISSTDTDRVF